MRCGDDLIDLSDYSAVLSANSVFLSENMISTTVSYQSIFDLLNKLDAPTNEQCELDVSIISTQTLVPSLHDYFTVPNQGRVDSAPISLSIEDIFANTENDIHTFTFYSSVVTFILNQ